MTNTIKIAAVLCAVTLICGCGSSKKENLKDYYMLEASRSAVTTSAAEQKADFTLIVDKFAVAEGFGGNSFIYRNKRGLFETDYYRRFFTDKGIMLSSITSQWLSDSGIFKLVADSRAGVTGDYRIKGLVNEMYADMSDPKNFAAKLKMRVFIVDRSGKVIFSNSYDITAPIAQANAEAVMAGANDCVLQYLTALEADLINAPLP